MNEILQGFINSISGKPEGSYQISTNCQSMNGEIYGTLSIAEEISKELKQSGYNANVLDYNTGEVLFIA